ncbi:hypothetical protein ACIPK7_05475 [Pseudomonas sp. NPDC086581]|uniref:hypothetical protein n=1 Tax=Pseudomonas sp. NPDC086581 TaxID=3364432 RepID=UPI00381E5C34
MTRIRPMRLSPADAGLLQHHYQNATRQLAEIRRFDRAMEMRLLQLIDASTLHQLKREIRDQLLAQDLENEIS